MLANEEESIHESELADELLTSDIPGVADVRFNLTAVIQLWGGERST
jgi:hypothetical protein